MLNYRTSRLALFAAALSLVMGAEASAQLAPDWVVRRDGVDGFFFGFQVPVYMAIDSQGAVYLNNSTLTVLKTDIQTVKYAPDGTEVWSVTYDGPSENTDRGRGITIDSAGDILVLGQSEGGFLVIKYDASDGSIIWTTQHEPGGNADVPNALTTDDAGNIYVTGQSWPSGNEWDFYTLKMDSAGNVLWTARYNGPGPFLFAHDTPVDIALDSNGDVFVTGPSNNTGGNPDYATIKYRGSDGAQLWLDRYQLSNDTPVDLIIDSQDNVYVTGFTEGQNHIITTIKYRNSNGERLWVALDAPATQNYATSLALDSQGDVYVAGRADPDLDESNGNDNAVVIRHRASDGAQLWTTLYGENVVGHFDNALDIVIDVSDNVYISGQTSSFGASADLLVLQYDATTGQIVDQGTYDVATEMVKGQALGLDSAQNVIVAGTTRETLAGFTDFLTLKIGSSVVEATTPNDFSAFRGFHAAGTLDDILESDDSDLCYEPGIVLNPTEAPVTLDFFGTLPNDSPSTLDVTIESSANTVGLELTFSFWNYNTNSWNVVGTATQSLNADTVRTFAGNPADHVEPDTGAVRTRYEVRVVSFIFIFPWTDCVDHVFWTTT